MSNRIRSRIKVLSFLVVLAVVLDGCDDHKPVLVVPPKGFDSAPLLIQGLQIAYQRRDYDKFRILFSNPTTPIPAEPAYQFLLSEPQNNETSWGYPEEMHIHRRMFRPEDTPPGETRVPNELWLQSIDISLTQQTEFVERTDLYYDATNNPGGLDPARWSVTEGTYATYVFFQLAGNTDYQVNGHANFVVIEDKTKTNGTVGKWLIYRWEDLLHKPLGSGPLGTEPSTWGRLKALYLR